MNYFDDVFSELPQLVHGFITGLGLQSHEVTESESLVREEHDQHNLVISVPMEIKITCGDIMDRILAHKYLANNCVNSHYSHFNPLQ